MRRVPILGAALCLALAIGAQEKKVEGDAKAGEKVFAAKCAECHNADSRIEKTGPGLKGIRNGALPSGEPATAEAILELIEDGREEMPPVGAELTDKQKKDVVAYVLTL